MVIENDEVYLVFNKRCSEAYGAFAQLTRERDQELFENAGIGEGLDPWLALISAGFSFSSITKAAFLARFPYAKPGLLDEHLEGAAARGWISYDGEVFTATEKAVSLNDESEAINGEVLRLASGSVTIDTARLAALLETLVETANKIDLPLKPTLFFSKIFEREAVFSPLERILHSVISLMWYRDDCHMSSWQKYDIPGHVWETLSYIWAGEITTAEKLTERLARYRGYLEEDYAAALARLIEMGWVEKQGAEHQVTVRGRQVREESEELTNIYYIKAFAALSTAELEELNSLLEGLAAEIAPKVVEEG